MTKIQCVKFVNTVKIGNGAELFFDCKKYDILFDGEIFYMKDKKGNVACSSIYNSPYWWIADSAKIGNLFDEHFASATPVTPEGTGTKTSKKSK